MTQPQHQTVDLDGWLDGFRPAERSVPVCRDGDLIAALQESQRLLDEAETARKAAGASLASGTRSRELAEQIETLRAQMQANMLTVRVRQLQPRKAYRDLKLAHPPREGNDRDRVVGANEDTFFDALVRACVVEPVFSDAQWERFNSALSDGQWQELVTAAWAVNERSVDVPFSRAASQVTQGSEDE